MSKTAIIVPAQDIPHDDIVPDTQLPGLQWCYLSIRRTVEIGMDKLRRHVYILHIIIQRNSPSWHMAVGMAAYRMTSPQNLSEQVRIQFHILADTEKSSLGTILVELDRKSVV